MRQALERTFYRYGWDTRCRNLAPARLLRSVLPSRPSQDGPILLDVGCGKFGIVTFLRGVPAIGIDRQAPAEIVEGVTFQLGDVTAIPFLDRSFPLVSCIDVLEHIPPDARDLAINELVRVASSAVLIACPHGKTAEECDKEFRNACESRARAIPAWVLEHEKHHYPVTTTVIAQIHKAAFETGRTARVTASYCEPASVCRLIRAAAARSGLLYAAVNLLMGALLDLLPSPDAGSSYRMIVLAELSPRSQEV